MSVAPAADSKQTTKTSEDSTFNKSTSSTNVVESITTTTTTLTLFRCKLCKGFTQSLLTLLAHWLLDHGIDVVGPPEIRTVNNSNCNSTKKNSVGNRNSTASTSHHSIIRGQREDQEDSSVSVDDSFLSELEDKKTEAKDLGKSLKKKSCSLGKDSDPDNTEWSDVESWIEESEEEEDDQDSDPDFELHLADLNITSLKKVRKCKQQERKKLLLKSKGGRKDGEFWRRDAPKPPKRPPGTHEGPRRGLSFQNMNINLNSHHSVNVNLNTTSNSTINSGTWTPDPSLFLPLTTTPDSLLVSVDGSSPTAGDDSSFACPICNIQFQTRSQLMGHTRKHMKDKLFQCKLCEQNFPTHKELKSHLGNKTETQVEEFSIKCGICSRAFPTQACLGHHLNCHKQAGSAPVIIDNPSAERRYSCSLCSKTFKNSQHVQRHLRIHTGEKPFSCDLCGQSFSLNHNLQRHMRTHTGEKPHKCPVCAKEFAEGHNLKRHMISAHDGPTPYICNICNRKFAENSILRKHQSRAHKQQNAAQAQGQQNPSQ